MKRENKIISFTDAIAKRNQENYIASLRISVFCIPIIGQYVKIKSTLGKNDIFMLEILVLLEETCEILKKRGIKVRRTLAQYGMQNCVIEFYMTADEKLYFYSDTDDETLMNYILIAIYKIKE